MEQRFDHDVGTTLLGVVKISNTSCNGLPISALGLMLFAYFIHLHKTGMPCCGSAFGCLGGPTGQSGGHLVQHSRLQDRRQVDKLRPGFTGGDVTCFPGRGLDSADAHRRGVDGKLRLVSIGSHISDVVTRDSCCRSLCGCLYRLTLIRRQETHVSRSVATSALLLNGCFIEPGTPHLWDFVRVVV